VQNFSLTLPEEIFVILIFTLSPHVDHPHVDPSLHTMVQLHKNFAFIFHATQPIHEKHTSLYQVKTSCYTVSGNNFNYA
jgi:hypothetical protein